MDDSALASKASRGDRVGGQRSPATAPDIPAERYCQVDLRDLTATRELVVQSRPTHVIHLAALYKASLEDYLGVNVVGTDHLYRALADAQLDPNPRIVQASSVAIYGRVCEEELPIGEDQELRPVSDYALSKACQDQLAAAWGYGRRLDIVRARLFNLLGPGQPEDLVPMAFLGQLRRYRGGIGKPGSRWATPKLRAAISSTPAT